MPRPLLFAEREAELAAYDRLPRSLWLLASVHAEGALAGRLAALEGMRSALDEGRAPEARDWLPAPLAEDTAAAFTALDLPAYCARHAGLGDQILQSLLWHMDRIVDGVDRGLARAQAEQLALESFRADWSERSGEIDELVHVLGDAGDLFKNTHWDMLRGLLRSSGWREVTRIRALIESMPELVRLIRSLGRARLTEEPDHARRTTLAVMREEEVEATVPRVVRVPEAPGEMRGVQRSGHVARMLPAEAVLLRHPRLRLVWHARLAERTLLAYDQDDRMLEQVRAHRPVWRSHERDVPDRRLEAGPLLVCVDTSGSMQGGAEAVAKAVVLEAARTAHAQGRACHVFAFSGPEEVVQMELGFDAEGVARMAQFMDQSFRGGTDIGGPLTLALEKMKTESWRLADLLIASDGEFGATGETARAVARAKDESGLRVEAVLIGDRETIGMLELADNVLWVRDWRRYGGHDAAMPAATRSLTAQYFPGALRAPRLRPAGALDAGEAARAVMRGQHAGEGPPSPSSSTSAAPRHE